jgi:hypothetical protein
MSIANALNQASRIVNKKLIINAINSCVVFPKADKLSTDKVLYEIHVESYHSNVIKIALDKDVDRLMRLYAVGAKKDVFDACEMVDEIAKSAPIDGIRFIQIHKTGVDLLRIYKIGNDSMERAAFLEMNEYKRSLLDEINRRTSILLVAGMAVTFMITGAKLSGIIEKFF